MSSRQQQQRSAPKGKSPSALPKAIFRTRLGKAFVGDSLSFLSKLSTGSVNLVVTSPPYALHFKKEYGNANQRDYVEWFLPFATEIYRVLRDDGSFVLNIGGAWTPGKPTRSLYQFELLLRLCREVNFNLAQDFYWFNPAKLPAPAEWVTVRKIRVKDSIEQLWWLSKTPHPKADNRQVLQPYSPDMERLIKKGYRPKVRPSGHVITAKFGQDLGGSIPPNVLIFGNNDANSRYFKRCEEEGRKPHPARFPASLPEFFIKFLTDEGDLVLDPFAGSNTTGAVCEKLERRWISVELNEDYLRDGAFRFESEEKSTAKPRDVSTLSLFGGDS